MPDLILIREPKVEDAPGLAEVHVRAWQTAYRGLMPDEFLEALDVSQRTTMWRELLKQRGSGISVFAADKGGGRIAGWILVGPCRDDPFSSSHPRPEDRGVGEVFAINLHPDFFRQGIGTKLMERGVAHLRKAGFREITLWVLEGNERARSFYAHLGWAGDGTTKIGTFGGAELTEVRYRVTFD